MADYRRWYQPGGTYFFTVVTYHRHQLFSHELARKLLGLAMRAVSAELPFKTIATVLLPDHLHAIWSMPSGDADYSTRWKQIKRDFTIAWLSQGGRERTVTSSQASRGHHGIWQRRFWEHQIRDEEDLSDLCDYIHYNPVKHKLVGRPWDWKYSTFRRFVAAGHYPKDWGRAQPESVADLDFE